MKQKESKLLLINYLSDPSIEILNWELQNEILTHDLNVTPWLWRKETGMKTLTLTIKRRDNSTTTT